MATASPKLKCFFKHIKKVNIFLYIIANLAGNINNIETYRVNRDVSRALQELRCRGREKGYTVSQPGLM